MKHCNSKALICALLATSSLVNALDEIAPYFSIRSQGFNAARKYAGVTNKINLASDDLYGALWTTIDYTRSFRPQRIAQCLFGDDALIMNSNCAGIQISGSQSPNRGEKDLLADYFGLPIDFKSRVFFRPNFDAMTFDFNWFQGLDDIAHGLYCSIQAPLIYTRWNLGMSEEIINHGIAESPGGYFGPEPLPIKNLLSSFTQFASGCCAPLIFDCSATSSQPRIMFKELNKAKMDTHRHTKTRIAELTFTAGWNFLQQDDERYHLGIAACTSAPTGNTPWGDYLFEPVIGNGHHWTFGGETNGHYTWQLGDTEQTLTLFGDIVAVHLFKAHQRRTFDLHGKPLSRYMLAQKLGTNTNSVPHLNPTATPPFPPVEFANVFIPLANLNTIDVDVSIGLQAECLAMLTYQNERFTWDLGYSFWGRTCDNISLTCAFASEIENMPNVWALKGDAFVIGLEDTPGLTPVRLAATQSDATIHRGTNMPAVDFYTNPGIDSPELATSSSAGNPAVLGGFGFLSGQTHSSVPPVYLAPTDIHLNDARTHGASHKILTNFMYTWDAKQGWIPYLGFGGEAEFGTGNKQLTNDCCKKSCTKPCDCPCINTSVSQWSFWIKGGIAF